MVCRISSDGIFCSVYDSYILAGCCIRKPFQMVMLGVAEMEGVGEGAGSVSSAHKAAASSSGGTSSSRAASTNPAELFSAARHDYSTMMSVATS